MTKSRKYIKIIKWKITEFLIITAIFLLPLAQSEGKAFLVSLDFYHGNTWLGILAWRSLYY
jgi:hypothetical protein